MSSIEREPLCTVDWCARPSDPDWHLCVVCGALATEHAHVQSRAQAPDRKLDKANQVMLCVPHHREVDERQGGTHSHHIRDLPGRGRVYFRLDLRGETLFEKTLPEPLRAPQQPVTALQPSNPTTATPADKAARWRAVDLVSVADSQLAWEFEHFYAASGMLKLEAYRRVEAYRLKYAGVAAESWVQKAETDFDLKESTLHQYSRAWQAFEQAVDQADLPEELADSFRMMGGGVWQVIGRQPEETWLQMSEIALNVVAEGGVSRGLPARVAAKGQEEGLVKKANVSLKCPSCGNVAPKGEYEKVK